MTELVFRVRELFMTATKCFLTRPLFSLILSQPAFVISAQLSPVELADVVVYSS